MVIKTVHVGGRIPDWLVEACDNLDVNKTRVIEVALRNEVVKRLGVPSSDESEILKKTRACLLNHLEADRSEIDLAIQNLKSITPVPVRIESEVPQSLFDEVRANRIRKIRFNHLIELLEEFFHPNEIQEFHTLINEAADNGMSARILEDLTTRINNRGDQSFHDILEGVKTGEGAPAEDLVGGCIHWLIREGPKA